MSTAIESRVTPIKSIEIYGREIRPEVGSFVIPDGKLVGECLLPGDETVDAGYRGCQFRWPVNQYPIDTVAIDIEITGRTLRRRAYQDGYFVRCKIVFVGDCEPDSWIVGWLQVK